MLNELNTFLKQRKKTNLFIIAVNIFIFIVFSIIGDTTDVGFMYEHGAMYPLAVTQDGELYRLFTCMFLHFGAEHLFYNCALLIFAGDMLESAVGAVKYLVIYILGGLAGNLVSLAAALFTGNYAVSAGASGAIFAVIGGLVFLVLNNKGKVPEINGRGLCIMAVLSLAQGFTESGVDNFAHLGGFLGGFLLAGVLGLAGGKGGASNERGAGESA